MRSPPGCNQKSTTFRHSAQINFSSRIISETATTKEMHKDSFRNGNNTDITERDAAHIRFREQGPTKWYRCSSCYRPFKASNIEEIMEHFERNEHKKSSSDCLYCHRAVYQYRTDSGEERFYHNCVNIRK